MTAGCNRGEKSKVLTTFDGRLQVAPTSSLREIAQQREGDECWLICSPGDTPMSNTHTITCLIVESSRANCGRQLAPRLSSRVDDASIMSTAVVDLTLGRLKMRRVYLDPDNAVLPLKSSATQIA